MRVLLAIEPGGHREEMLFALKEHRPHFSVKVSDPRDMVLEAIRFRPHFAIFANGLLPPPREASAWRLLVLSLKRGIALAQAGDLTWRIEDMGIENLLEVADEAERSAFGR